MNKEKLTELYKEYKLEKEDVFKHQHYLIITRSGIEKLMAQSNMTINYEVVKCEPNFAVIKALGNKEGKRVETFGSALKGVNYKDGSTNSWYVMELAEKRSQSRCVLKMLNLYEYGVFGEDESESFKK
jgi:hypothetical protein|tara:strand:- start:636 stop:1019 length:384 start_codon:yes stop_codon:yes gene_type:complete